MIRRLIILLLIVGCATKPIKPIMIIDGTINTGSTTVISVTGFRNNTSNSEVDWIGESIADNITSDLVRISSLNIVNRKDLKKILQEQKFQHSGLVDLEKVDRIEKKDGEIVSGVQMMKKFRNFKIIIRSIFGGIIISVILLLNN